jgi:AraC-like DNA-binding protein
MNELIEKHITPDIIDIAISLAELSRITGVNKIKLKKYFKDNYNLTYPEFRKKYLKDNNIENPLSHVRVVKPIDWQWVRKQLETRCSFQTIAKGLGIHNDTLKKRCWDDLGISIQDLKAECEIIGEDLLRTKMFDIALNGNVNMLIWLSKNILNYSEKGIIKEEKEKETALSVNFIYNEKPQI